MTIMNDLLDALSELLAKDHLDFVDLRRRRVMWQVITSDLGRIAPSGEDAGPEASALLDLVVTLVEAFDGLCDLVERVADAEEAAQPQTAGSVVLASPPLMTATAQ